MKGLKGKFKVKKSIGRFKKDAIVDSFGGIVSGIDGIPFTNKEYFHPAWMKEKKEKPVKVSSVEWAIEGYRGKKL